jgi:hypothetical protein
MVIEDHVGQGPRRLIAEGKSGRLWGRELGSCTGKAEVRLANARTIFDKHYAYQKIQ